MSRLNFVLALFAAFALTACGGTDDSNSENGNDTLTSQEDVAEEVCSTWTTTAMEARI